MRATTGVWGVVSVVFLSGLSALPAAAQVQWATRADDRRCDDRGGRDDDESFCELREATFAAPSRLSVNGGGNGAVSIAGSDRRDVQVLAHVWAHAQSESDAQELASQVELTFEGGRLTARGPRPARREYWGVDWELSVPHALDLQASTVNGGIAISDVSGAIDFEATNGAIDLSGVAGDVRGQTVNGGLHVELAGSKWDGRGLDAETTNGAVTLIVPDGYGAELETGTVNGGFDVDFPVTVQGRLGRTLRTTLGSGGPPIRAVTTNGGVRIRRR